MCSKNSEVSILTCLGAGTPENKKTNFATDGGARAQKLKKQILQRTPTNKNKMFRRQFLMLQAILKVMELFGGAHGAQKILNYRF